MTAYYCRVMILVQCLGGMGCAGLQRGQTMTEEHQSNETRRTFMKGAAATGVAATGLTAFSGSAAAQEDVTLRDLQLNITEVQSGLVNLRVENVRVIRDITVQDIDVTIIGRSVAEGDIIVDIIDDVTVTFEDRVINIQDIDVDILSNFDTIQVAVAVLGGAQNIIAQGSDSALAE